MESNQNVENVFKFGVYQGSKVVCEVIHSANFFNPVIRYSVDIRNDISGIISDLQNVLSKRSYNHKFDIGNGKKIDVKKHKIGEIKKYTSEIQDQIKKGNTPKVGVKTKGVECKFGLYINNKPIVERMFYVDNYNPDVVLSGDIINTVDNTLAQIISNLRDADINLIWEDKDLINKYNMSIYDIREMDGLKREKLLNRIYN